MFVDRRVRSTTIQRITARFWFTPSNTNQHNFITYAFMCLTLNITNFIINMVAFKTLSRVLWVILSVLVHSIYFISVYGWDV